MYFRGEREREEAREEAREEERRVYESKEREEDVPVTGEGTKSAVLHRE